jgi:hypothetical protein
MLMKVGFHHDPGPMSHSDAAFYVPFFWRGPKKLIGIEEFHLQFNCRSKMRAIIDGATPVNKPNPGCELAL